MPALSSESWHAPLTAELLEQLSAYLPEFIASRRWFRAKTRSITGVLIEDVVPFAEHNSWLLVLVISYSEGEADRYLLPVSLSSHEDFRTLASETSEAFASYRASSGEEGFLHSAFANARFRALILQALATGQTFQGSNGLLAATPTQSPGQQAADFTTPIESFVSRAEQSNTSIIFGDQFILKLFRKVEAGINPDIEIGRFLTEHDFANTPAVLGTLEYRSTKHNATFAAGILQKFVKNQGDAWKYTLDSLSGFFGRALAEGESPQIPTLHPLELMRDVVPPKVSRLLNGYYESASLLGKRTAEMHIALSSASSNPDFTPEPFSPADGQALYREMLAQADTSFQVLRLRASSLTGAAAAYASDLLARELAVRDRFALLQETRIGANRIRFHGDYHLGQVLATGDDFMIIDFEGEPARPLSERRAKTLPLRDVAGMIRSFQYAGYASLFGQVAGLPAGDSQLIDNYAAFWTAWVTAIYLQGYFDAAGNASFLPQSEPERRLVLDAFLLHKALYEVAYELNNRPDWVSIPLRGILGLL